MNYIVLNKETGQEVYRYTADSAIPWAGMDFAVCDHLEAPVINLDGSIEGQLVKRRLTKLEFIEALGENAFVAILQMAKVSPIIEAWVEKMKLATPDPDGTSVDLADPRTIAGIEAIGQALEAQGIVTAGWAEGVLA